MSTNPTSSASDSASTPASNLNAAAAPFVPSAPSTVRTIDNQGTPDPALGAEDDDICDPDAHRTIQDLVKILMNPHKSAYKDASVIIKMEWVKRVISEKHFIFDPSKHRSVLRNDSKIRTHGLQYGLPQRYYEWLCGNQVSKTFGGVGTDFVYIKGPDWHVQ
jgi:hypothetical protein